MSKAGAVIVNAGMVSPVGIGVDQTAASVRAGVARFEESAVHNRRFEPVTMALVPEEYLEPLVPEIASTPRLTSRQARMLRLAGPALREVAGGQPVAGVPLFLGLPGPHGEDDPEPAGEPFLQQLMRQAGVVFDLSGSQMISEGRAAGILALQSALECLDARKAEQVLVGGVDTYLDLNLLAALDLEERVAGTGVMDGFIPGEGAAFLMLRSASKRAAAGGLTVEAVGVAEEPGHRYAEDEPYKGEGLPNAIEEIAEALGDDSEPANTVFAGFNGESFWAKEWGSAYLRHSKLFAEEFEVEHPADCFGDTGAALGPMMIALAHAGAKAEYLAGPFVVWASSDHAPRGCAYLRS